jgi:16S rRNA (guanine527-N7)-methyltransferase
MVTNLEIIQKYFPEFTKEQISKLYAFVEAIKLWNEQINLVSRKDIANFEVNHLLHSLTIYKLVKFERGTRVLDVGTGGGLPGIPLAIMNPDAQFVLIDRIGKKVEAVKAIALKLGLRNVEALQINARDIEGPFDFVVSRAVTRLPEFKHWIEGKLSAVKNNAIPNGILYLKGGDVEFELKEVGWPATVYDLSKSFPEPWFETKKLIHLRDPSSNKK